MTRGSGMPQRRPKGEIRDGNKVLAEKRRAAAAEIFGGARSLQALAQNSDLYFLAYLLEMTALEAQKICESEED